VIRRQPPTCLDGIQLAALGQPATGAAGQQHREADACVVVLHRYFKWTHDRGDRGVAQEMQPGQPPDAAAIDRTGTDEIVPHRTHQRAGIPGLHGLLHSSNRFAQLRLGIALAAGAHQGGQREQYQRPDCLAALGGV
jgi:hypothetical protein